MNAISVYAKNITAHPVFTRIIIGTILFSAFLVGLKTYPEIYTQHKTLLYYLDSIILGIFTVEITLRILAHGSPFVQFFRSGWNIFDFLVTIIFFIPGIGEYSAVLRVARVLRVLRLITTIPRLQILVGALLHSFPSMGYIGLLLFIQFYVFAVIGNTLFAATSPEYFGNLHTSMLTLFQVVTLEGWTSIMQQQGTHWYVVPYFISFILTGTMIILNLFIGVILSGFEEMKNRYEKEMLLKETGTANKELLEISSQLEALQQKVHSLITPHSRNKKNECS